MKRSVVFIMPAAAASGIEIEISHVEAREELRRIYNRLPSDPRNACGVCGEGLHPLNCCSDGKR